MERTESSNHGAGWKSRLRPESEILARVSIPEHKLLCRIGSGSYGEVWLARAAMGAYRAAKIVFRDSFDSDRPFERELTGIRKFEPISRLHEGFIDILQTGINEAGGYFYYVMEAGDDQVTGQKIDPAAYSPNTLQTEISRRGKLALQECLQLGLALSHALAELHKHSLVHRDIKPSNVIFVDGVPKLADIGLVADAHDSRSFVGTEGFVPPEGPGKPQADVFSLGMLLYEASTGNDRHQFPELPLEWNQSPDAEGLVELNEVILKACEADSKARYLTAWDVHANLVVVLNGKSVKRLKLLERRLAQAKKAAGLGAVLLLLAGLILFQIFREWRAAVEKHERQVAADISYGNRAMEAGDLLGALPFFAEALKMDEGRSERELTDRLRLGATLAQCPKLVQMWCEPIEVSDAEFSPDGERVVLAQYFGKAKVCDLATGTLRSQPFGPQQALRSAVYSPDGHSILTTSESNKAIIWDAETITEVHSLPHANKVYTGRFSPDGRRVVTACNDGIGRVWDVKTGQLEFPLRPHSGTVAFAGFSHDGRLIVTASHDHTARVWSAVDGTPVSGPLRHPMWVNWAQFSPDDQTLVTACEDHKVRMFEVSTGRLMPPDMRHDDAVKSVEFSPDGQLILTAAFDGTVRLWDAEDHQPAAPIAFLQHGERARRASFSSDGRLVSTACVDGVVRVWDLSGAVMSPGPAHRTFCRNGSRYLETKDSGGLEICGVPDRSAISQQINPSPNLASCQLTPNGDFVLTVSEKDKTNHLVQVWSAKTGRAAALGFSVPAPFRGAVASDNGELVATFGGTNAQIWSVSSGKPFSPVLAHRDSVATALFSPNAHLLATLNGTNVYVWNTHDGSLVHSRLGLLVNACFAEFSRDGRFLAACCADNLITKCHAQIWNVETGRPVGEPLLHGDGVLSVSFSEDGKRVVTASEDFTAKIWESATGKQIGLPMRHAGQVHSARFSPDGRWVATASIDHTARVWDAQTGDPITPPLRALENLWDVKFVRDGRHLAVQNRSGTVEWDLLVDTRHADELVELANLLYGGEFISPVNPTKRTRQPLSAIWASFCARDPAGFATSKEQVARWHGFQAEASESSQHWKPALVQFDELLKVRPGDPWALEHIARVKEHLKNGD